MPGPSPYPNPNFQALGFKKLMHGQSWDSRGGDSPGSEGVQDPAKTFPSHAQKRAELIDERHRCGFGLGFSALMHVGVRLFHIHVAALVNGSLSSMFRLTCSCIMQENGEQDAQ